MFCIKTEIPQEICEIDDELKAIYHSKDSQGIAKLKYQSFEGRVDKNGDLIATLFFNPGDRWNAMVDKLIVFEGNIDKKKLSGMYDDVKLYFYLVKK